MILVSCYADFMMIVCYGVRGGMERGENGGKSVVIMVSLAVQYNEVWNQDSTNGIIQGTDGWEIDTWMT